MTQQIFVFSDVHYARNWDTIDACLKQHRHNENYLNPNRELKRFIDLANQTPNVEAVINNGDAVDYHFCDYTPLSGLILHRQIPNRPSNLNLFNREIQQLQKKYISVPGNHECRTEAYNYSIWGTDHIHVPKKILKKYRHRIGHQAFRGPWELSTIMVNAKRLSSHSKRASILKKRDIRLSQYHCIFLDSGSDAFVRSANLLKYFKQLLQTRTISYDSDGLKQSGLDFLTRTLSKTAANDILIFQHAPLINSRESKIGKSYRLSINRFDELRRRQKINYSTIFNGGGRLLKILRDSDKNIVIISSHIHQAKYFLIDKKSLKVMEVSNGEFNKYKNTQGKIKHLTTMPLGVVNLKDGGRKTGFLKISPNGFEEKVFNKF